MAWDLGALRAKAIAKQTGDAKELEALIYAMGRYQEIFEYHKCLARDAFKAFHNDAGPDKGKFFVHALGGAPEEEQDTLRDAALVSEANLIACIGITRGAFDSFGELVNRLAFPVPLPGLYVGNVRDKLPAGDLKNALDAALSANWFVYISDFMNVSKHRTLINHAPTMSFTDDNQGGKVAGFTHHNHGRPRTHPSYWATDVLEGAIEVWTSLIKCGVELNRHYI